MNNTDNTANFTRLELINELSNSGWQQVDDGSWTHPDLPGECLDTVDALAAMDEMDKNIAMSAAHDAYMRQFDGDA